MGILDKLVEKKNIEIYCNVRIAQLIEDMSRALEKTPDSQKQYVVEKFSGRIAELRKLKEVAKGNHFREYSIRHFDTFVQAKTKDAIEYRKMIENREIEREGTPK